MLLLLLLSKLRAAFCLPLDVNLAIVPCDDMTGVKCVRRDRIGTLLSFAIGDVALSLVVAVVEYEASCASGSERPLHLRALSTQVCAAQQHEGAIPLPCSESCRK
uniref:Secreted protein n=1 Tax=Craspedostauros australis TaxID=1486917 RepID=A0A6T6GLI0_9STRA